MKHVLRLLVHLSPLLPLAYGYRYAAIAMLLFVVLCYVKVFKLKQQLLDLADKGGDPKEENSISDALARWRFLTYMRNVS